MSIVIHHGGVGREQLRADAYTANLDANDSKKFWKQVQKDSCNKVKKFAVSVNGAVVDDNIAAMWKTYFENVYTHQYIVHTIDNCLKVELMPWHLY